MAAVAAAALCALASLGAKLRRRLPPPSQAKLDAICRLRALAETAFDPENQGHLELLARVAKRYFGVSDNVDWTRIGFQRKASPVTDLRAMGILGLHVMSGVTATPFVPPEDSSVPSFFFALAVLRISHDILERAGKDDAYLSRHFSAIDSSGSDATSSIESDVAALCAEVDSVLSSFEGFWLRKKPASVMEFEMVYKEFWKSYV